MTKPVFATNFDTVHRIACFKRDVQGDVTDMTGYTRSVLFDSAADATRKAARAQELDGWWAIDTVTLFDDRTVEAIVRTSSDTEDVTKMRFVLISYTLSYPASETPSMDELIRNEKLLLNYWFIPDEK